MVFLNNYKPKFFSERQEGVIDSFVFHSTELPFSESLEMLLGKAGREVSAHYLIDLNGDVHNIVEPKKKAWHAGESYWRGREGLNEYSIGFELVDRDANGNEISFQEKQMASLVKLCHELMMEFNIDQRNIVAHSDIAPERKKDPGENFDWLYMSENNIGLYYDRDKIIEDKVIKAHKGDVNKHVYMAKKLLMNIGYKIQLNDIYDDDFANVAIAFKRRFYQRDLSGNMNNELFEIMNNLSIKYI